MRGVYRHSRSDCVACGMGVALFAVLLAGLIVVAWTEGSVGSPWGMTALAVGVPGTMLVISLWGLFASVRGQMEVDDDLVVQTGALSTRSVCLSDLTAIRWTWHAIIIAGPTGRVRISPNIVPQHDYFEFMRCLRNAAPIAIQTGWELFFCWKILPLLQCKALPGPGEFVATRRRWDVIFAVTLLPAAAVGWFVWDVTGKVPMLCTPVLLVPLWLLMRCSTPKRGMIVQSSNDKSHGHRTFLIQWACIVVLGCTGLSLLVLYQDMFPGLDVAMVIGSILLVALMLYFARQEDRRREARRQREHAELVAQFDWITGCSHPIHFTPATNEPRNDA